MANQEPTGSATGTHANGSLNTTHTLYKSTLLPGYSDAGNDTLAHSCKSVAGKPSDDLAPDTLNSILKQSKLKD